MEDFGYQKNDESTKSSELGKKIFLFSATLLSISAFVYITLNAYYFANNENKNVETLKSPEFPIKTQEDEDYEENSDSKIAVNRLVYEDIFGNKKESVKNDEAKINKNQVPVYPPKKVVESNVAKSPATESKEEKEIVSPQKVEEKATETKKEINNSKQNIAETTTSNVSTSKESRQAKRKAIRVQISAMSSRGLAKENWEKLNHFYPTLFAGYKHFIEEADLGKRGIFYRLQIGDFFNQVDAENFCSRFVAQTQKTRADCMIVE